MPSLNLRNILEQVQSGKLSIEAALRQLDGAAMADLGYAQVDLHRQQRCGFPEVVFCEGKTCEWVEAVVRQLHEAGQACLATRVSEEQAAHLRQCFPQAAQDRLGRTFWLPSAPGQAGDVNPLVGKVTIVTAGTADLPVAHEAVATARALGCKVDLLADVGVAGIHRLFRNLDRLKGADALVVVAGMEGALPSVVAGLVARPVIAVPTSVGYGASFGGVAALLGMLNSCGSGVTVVNIDNGFGAGYAASQINALAAEAAATAHAAGAPAPRPSAASRTGRATKASR